MADQKRPRGEVQVRKVEPRALPAPEAQAVETSKATPPDRRAEYNLDVRRVWVIDLEKRAAAVYQSLTQVRQVEEDAALDGEDVLPGFSCPLARILGER